jgi:uncharacterized RDD family membrane protein YckC
VTVLGSLACIAGSFWYYASFHARLGQTPGKKAVSIKVIAPDGSLLSGGRAFVRVLVYFVESFLASYLVGFLGLLWMVWDKNKQTWHDKAAGSYVIRV